ncbi:speckle-type POZ protein B-like, partial [Trichogramma pretiosum]|uniref:speckle-type POZ protein B-like n=1 Tax=Trichogramma pretiosum TaxID=7493 RepID=UPI000C718F58
MASTQRMKATTRIVTDKCLYTWTIENYRMIRAENGESIESPEFSVGSDSKKYFQLKLYPAGNREDSAGFNSIFLYYLKTDLTKKLDKLIIRLKISAINNEKVVETCSAHEDYAEKTTWGWSKFYDLKNIEKLISSKNTVTIQCELEVFKEYESSLDSRIINNESETIDQVKFDSAFLSKEFSDVELITSDENSISAHRIILAMASPVFKAMLTHDMLERKNNSVEIIDTPYNILIEMLRYIYTGEISSTKPDKVLEILAVADKYQIDNLKVKCEKILCAELSTENALDILEAALKYNIKNLANEAKNFVTAHIQLFVNTEKFKNIVDPGVLHDVIQ